MKSLWSPQWNTVFKSLEKTGDSASLGQVHFGKLKSGTAVAVKIQYPEIGSSVETELELMRWLPKVEHFIHNYGQAAATSLARLGSIFTGLMDFSTMSMVFSTFN
ncbi:MAG TPA: hypothetical protein DCX78_04100 [Nitrospina sp.]|nr:hypothetical protein [Nitrospina sp.]